MRERWDRDRVIAILKSLRDEKGISVAQMATWAGVSQAQTVYRWMGEGGVRAPQPTRIPVQNLAWAIESRHPELARQLVKAAGHPWEDAPEDAAPTQDPLADALGSEADAEEVRRKIRRHKGAAADWYITALEDALREPPEGADEPPAPDARQTRR